MSILQDVERSIHVYKIETNLRFNDIKDILDYIDEIRRRNPNELLYDVGGGTRYLYAALHGVEVYSGNDIIWIKFGWARRTGLPETLNTSAGRTEYLRLPSGVYLYEPSHFLLLQHGDDVLLLHEYNFFAPRPTRLCQYLAEFYKRKQGSKDIRVKISPRRVFTKDVERLLQGYTVVKSLRIELNSSAINQLARVLGGSETVLDTLMKPNPKAIVITWKSGPRTELKLTIDDVLNMFYELEAESKSFVVSVKKGVFGRPVKIDLKKHALIFRKRIKLARDEQGNVYRSTDTDDAISVLKDTISEVIEQLS